MAENDLRDKITTSYVADRRSWSKKLKYLVVATDTIALTAAFLLAHIIKFRFTNPTMDGRNEIDITYISVSVILIIVWVGILGLAGSRKLRVLGEGSNEFNIITRSSIYLFAFIVTFSYLTEIDIARRYLVFALLLGWLFIIINRLFIRNLIVKYRYKGRMLTQLMIVGEQPASEHLIKLLKQKKQVGLNPVAVHISATTTKNNSTVIPEQIITGYGDSPKKIISEVEKNNIQALIVTDGHQMTPETLRELGWELALRDVALMLAPATTDIAGPRIHMTPMNGFPLIHVSTPRLDGLSGVLKRSIDVIASGLGLLVISPLLLVIGLIVKKDGGPAFYSQERIGKNGVPFKMWKFRSMVTNADELKAQLIAEHGGGDALLFKMKDDPRITPIGKFIRRYSIDELPQLWNVFIGDMSLVGPRPQVQDEVNQYTKEAYRRLLVSPGLTGLWQVSGRSKLTWEEALRFDLYYVENWSLAGDIAILFRTVKAVVGKDGAY